MPGSGIKYNRKYTTIIISGAATGIFNSGRRLSNYW